MWLDKKGTTGFVASVLGNYVLRTSGKDCSIWQELQWFLICWHEHLAEGNAQRLAAHFSLDSSLSFLSLWQKGKDSFLNLKNRCFLIRPMKILYLWFSMPITWILLSLSSIFKLATDFHVWTSWVLFDLLNFFQRGKWKKKNIIPSPNHGPSFQLREYNSPPLHSCTCDFICAT